MNKLNDFIRSLKGLRSLTPATNNDIADAEEILNLRFSDEFKCYLLEFGAIYSEKVELKGFAKTKGFNVASFTKAAQEIGLDFPRDLYVVAETGVNGIVICQKEDGSVYEWEPNHEPRKIAASLYEYVKNHAMS